MSKAKALKPFQIKHAELIKKLGSDVIQGAWAMPRAYKRIFRERLPAYIG